IMLESTRKEKLPEDTIEKRCNSGTIFYHKQSSPQRFYVKCQGKEIYADLPNDDIDAIGACGDDGLYFISGKKVNADTEFSAHNFVILQYINEL
ncbi:hypothetical protein PENTCL1PPCAC_4691, partial [Pristionchus entomophagus]